MARDEKKEFRIEDPAQIAELVSPVRMELVDTMSSIGPCSIADLAEEMGRPADALYYHVRKLVKCGLFLGQGERERAGRTEALYDVPAPRMHLEHDLNDSERMGLIADASSAVLRLTDRNLRQALLSGQSTGTGTARSAWAGRSRAWLTEEELKRVNLLIAQVADIYFSAEKRANTQLHSFAFALAPIPVGRRRRSDGGDSDAESRAGEDLNTDGCDDREDQAIPSDGEETGQA